MAPEAENHKPIEDTRKAGVLQSMPSPVPGGMPTCDAYCACKVLCSNQESNPDDTTTALLDDGTVGDIWPLNDPYFESPIPSPGKIGENLSHLALEPASQLEAHALVPTTQTTGDAVIWMYKVEQVPMDKESLQSHLDASGGSRQIMDKIGSLLPVQLKLIQYRTQLRGGHLVSVQHGSHSDLATPMGTFPVQSIIFVIKISADASNLSTFHSLSQPARSNNTQSLFSAHKALAINSASENRFPSVTASFGEKVEPYFLSHKEGRGLATSKFSGEVSTKHVLGANQGLFGGIGQEPKSTGSSNQMLGAPVFGRPSGESPSKPFNAQRWGLFGSSRSPKIGSRSNENVPPSKALSEVFTRKPADAPVCTDCAEYLTFHSKQERDSGLCDRCNGVTQTGCFFCQH